MIKKEEWKDIKRHKMGKQDIFIFIIASFHKNDDTPYENTFFIYTIIYKICCRLHIIIIVLLQNNLHNKNSTDTYFCGFT